MNEREIFTAALEIEGAGERSQYLDAACSGDSPLRLRVEALLAEHQRDDSFLLDSPPPGLGATVATPILTEKPGTIIGPYKLRELLGEGGMGNVYVAEQETPVRRKVALKIIKPGMDSQQVLVRFEAERQALALMDHPNIAKVLDAGTTESGRPYFVMELVRGVPITEFCDQRQLDLRQRLELFIQVCRAIQHAHQKGIIHRDIKPSNTLVTLHDTLAVPKVIDFGIAKATGQQLTEQTVYTAFNQLIGTPLYMSPEQAEMNALDVDTRSDVYSLGVLLYELLTGSTPFASDTFRQAGFDEMRRLIREVDPPRPSHRVSTLNAQAASTVSLSRGVDERHLSRVLRGELDLIVMKALEKDRNRRYESAGALALDVERYLADEPVEACPPSAVYRFGKFARRNRTAITIAATVLSSLLLLTVVSGVSTVLVSREREIAVAQLVEAKKNRERADNNFRDALHVLDFFARTNEASLRDVPAQHAMQDASATRVRDFLEQFLLEQSPDPAIRLHTGIAYVHLGRLYTATRNPVKAGESYRQASKVFRSLTVDYPSDPVPLAELATCEHILGCHLYAQGDSASADTHLQLAHEICRYWVQLAPIDARDVWVIECMLDMRGTVDAGTLDRARESLQLLAAAKGMTASNWCLTGAIELRAGRWQRAVDALNTGIAQTNLGNQHYHGTSRFRYYLAMAYWHLGMTNDARTQYELAVDAGDEVRAEYEDNSLLRAEADKLMGFDRT